MSCQRRALALLLGVTFPSSIAALLMDRSKLKLKATNADASDHTSFEDYIVQHSRTYQLGTQEYEKRRLIYEQRLATINQQNSQANRLWTATINKLTDRTEEELKMLRGYKRTMRQAQQSQATQLSLLEMHSTNVTLPQHVSWGNLNATTQVQDQSSCGSCWAFTVSTVLRAHYNIYQGMDRTFSPQELVSCVRNPQRCGGTGGCEGATTELAIDYVWRHGLATDDEFPYTASDSRCPHSAAYIALKDSLHKHSASAALGMTGWSQLPENQQKPLMFALATMGPVAVSIMGDLLNVYSHGIIDNCPVHAIIDHTVALIGYGEEENGVKYWRFQNSWGVDWGDHGYFRLLRTDDADTEYCGVDVFPQLGSGCDGGPAAVRVCGMCGMLYDMVVPHFQLK